MQIAIGSGLGCLLGIGAWQLAGWFVNRAQAQGVAGSPDVPPAPVPRGRLFSPARLLIVVAMALWGAYLGWRASLLSQVILGLAFSALLVALSWTDLRVRRLPNGLLLALLGLGIIQTLWLGRPTFPAAGLGLLAGGGLFLLLALLGRGAMGAGDVKLAAALGAWLGFPHILPALLYGVLAGGLAALLLLVTHRAGRKDWMAYGPYLALGAWIAWTQAAGVWP